VHTVLRFIPGIILAWGMLAGEAVVRTLVMAGPGDPGIIFYGVVIAGLAMASRGFARMLDARQALAEARAVNRTGFSQEPRGWRRE
jgi:hypothetical protein